MLPETLVLEGGVVGRESSAPVQSSQEPGQLVPLTRPESILRLGQVVAVPVAADPAPLRLTVVSAAPAAAELPTVWDGPALRHVREARGLTLGELAESTKVARHHLENIEADRYDRLPSYVYLRGTLLSVAKELRLDAQQVCRSYLDAAHRATAGAH